jgi:DNA excision repair protein ERCC-2
LPTAATRTARKIGGYTSSSSDNPCQLKQELHIAVRTLVEHTLRCGDLDFEFVGGGRPADAIRAHQALQKSRPANYQAEVPVSYLVETDRFRLRISGRIDGIFSQPQGVIIEEIKTTTRQLEVYTQTEDPLHWGQIKCYAFMVAVDRALEAVDTQLVYHHLDTGETREIQRRFQAAELEVFFQSLITRYIRWAEAVIDWQRVRDDSIRQLEFPFDTFRPGQRRMAVAVFRTIQAGQQMLVQAATGIGKTMAAVFPAVKAMAQQQHPKLFYLTARTTGQYVAEKALDRLRSGGLKLKSLTLTAKDKICFNPESTCSPEECDYARGHYDRIGDALNELFRLDAFTRETVQGVAARFRVCPFEFSLELALWADCIICDYNYAFDPRVFLRRLFVEEIGDYTFLIDEAHNLVDRSREMFSAELTKQPFLDVRRSLNKALPQVYQRIGKINAWLVRARRRCEQRRSEKSPPEDLYPLLRRFLKAAESWLAQNVKAAFRDDLLDLYFAVSGFMRVTEYYNDCYATCYERTEADFKLKLFCIDPSGHLREALGRSRAAVFFSATLTPPDYFRKILGCDDSADYVSLASPFPRNNLALFISNRVSILYRDRTRTQQEVSRILGLFTDQKAGNYLLFFPSYEYMQQIQRRYQEQCPHVQTIVQTSAMTESQRIDFLKRFDRENPATLVGFAVMGGIFGEGIDLVGERLSGAAIVGVGLPAISLERELIREHFGNNGFEFAYLYPGLTRVFQAAGRVIRTETDRGVVLLVDQRYGTARYTSLFPQQWRPVPIRSENQFTQDLQRFWAG